MFIFKFFVWVVLFFAALVIFSTNALYSILSLAFTVLSTCAILFLLEVEFLSFILILLYTGAITVLFLFVVMMVRLNVDKATEFNIMLSFSNGILFILFLFKCFHFSFWFNTQIGRTVNLFSFKFLNCGSDYSFTNVLLLNGDSVIFCIIFTQKYFLFLLVAVILLFSMVGSIVLCSRSNN